MSEPWKKYGKPWEKYNAPADTSQVQQSTEQPIGSNLSDAFTGSQQKLSQAREYLRQGDLPAGIGAGGQALVGGVTELTGIPTALRLLQHLGPAGEFVGSGLEGVLGVPQSLFNLGSSVIDKGLRGAGVPEKVLNPFQTEAGNKEMTGLTSQAGGLATSALMMGGVPKISGYVGNKLQNIAQKIETKAITPPFNAQKGLEVLDRQVSSAVKGNYGPSRRGIAKLEKDLNSLNGQSQRIAVSSAKKGTTIDTTPTYQYLLDKLDKSEKSSASYPELKSAIDDVAARIDRVASQYPDGNLPIDVAVELKRSFQKMASGKFDQQLPVTQTQIAMYKDVSNHLLDQIIKKEPALRNIGLKQRDLIELQPILERKVASQSKSSLIDKASAVKIGLATTLGYATHNPVLGMGAWIGEQMATNPRALHHEAVLTDRLGTAMQFPNNLRKP